MNLDEVYARYSDSSRRASDVARQLAFAGVAIVWLFSGGAFTSAGSIHIEERLRWPGALLVVSLLLDFLHATYQAALWGYVGWHSWRRDIKRIDVPRQAHWPTLTFFWGKLLTLGIAYVLLAIYFVSKVT